MCCRENLKLFVHSEPAHGIDITPLRATGQIAITDGLRTPRAEAARVAFQKASLRVVIFTNPRKESPHRARDTRLMTIMSSRRATDGTLRFKLLLS